MGDDIQFPFSEGLYLVLILADNDAHLRLAHPFQLAGKLGVFLIRCRTRKLFFESFYLQLPVFLNIVIHPYTRYLVETNEHGLAGSPQVAVMPGEILGDSAKSRLCGQNMYFLFKFALELLLTVGIEIGGFDGVEYLFRYVGIPDLPDLFASVLVIKRNGGTVLDGALEIVDRDIASECPRGYLVGGKQRRAGKAYS